MSSIHGHTVAEMLELSKGSWSGTPDFRDGVWAGVDGSRSGWVICRAQVEATQVAWQLQWTASLAAWWDRQEKMDLVLIDIPIGLPEASRPLRAVDGAARRLLRGIGKSASFFSPPLREVADMDNYQAALRLSRQWCGRGFSLQAFHLLPKIREVRDFLQTRPRARDCLLEAHPELAFWRWSGLSLASKKTAEGRIQRATLLAVFPGPPFVRALPAIPRRYGQIDDACDAAILLRSAICGPLLVQAGEEPERIAY